jgi:cytochrome P450
MDCFKFASVNEQVMPNLYAIHMDPEVWKDPNVFRPERFLDDEGSVILKDLVIPFSIGWCMLLPCSTRLCKLLIMFLMLARLSLTN